MFIGDGANLSNTPCGENTRRPPDLVEVELMPWVLSCSRAA